MDEVYVSSAKAAELLKVSLRTIQLWVEKGVLSAWKTPGGHRRIPMAAVRQLLERQTAVEEDTLPPLKVLIAEDDPITRKLYQTYFEHWDLPVKLAVVADGYRALLKIGEENPDLLITDLIMPGMDGFRMIEALRGIEAHRTLEIVVVTSVDGETLRHRGLEREDVQIVRKPIDFQRLKAIVEGKLARRDSV